MVLGGLAKGQRNAVVLFYSVDGFGHLDGQRIGLVLAIRGVRAGGARSRDGNLLDLSNVAGRCAEEVGHAVGHGDVCRLCKWERIKEEAEANVEGQSTPASL